MRARRQYREKILEVLRQPEQDWTLDEESVEIGNESQYFACSLSYEGQGARAAALRPHVKLEVAFVPPTLPVERRSLQSFVARAQETAAEVPAIACIAPVETGADKISALSWRVLTRNRRGDRDDPALIRHLHDLAALESVLVAAAEFGPLAIQRLADDGGRGNPSAEVRALSANGRAAAALAILREDGAYRGEYESFAQALCYGRTDEIPTFNEGLSALQRLIAALP